ncbi:MAG: hypothetical protein G01um101425_647 [Candidatus Peregrinibacteria bacterium Gr01-1014_25]|nr:MAG: hypothetical protein G01um101425_647 [Candidatus Peregrinibacteria bacterium Gr01-1014_25]
MSTTDVPPEQKAEVPTGVPVEQPKTIWEDPLLTDEMRREFIADLRRNINDFD